MTREELLQALRGMKVETGSLACLGCGHEYRCSRHGCAVIKAAIREINILAAQNAALTDNPPLTLEELREMDGEPVWNDTMMKWALVDLTWEYGERTVDADGDWRGFDDRYYRRKPEEGERDV